MKKKPTQTASERLEIRLTPKDKKLIRQKAEKAGYSHLSEFLLGIIKNTKLHDSRWDKTIFTSVDRIAFELNKIGTNINQAAHAIHIMKLNASYTPSEIKNFNSLFSEYRGCQEELLEILKKIRFE